MVVDDNIKSDTIVPDPNQNDDAIPAHLPKHHHRLTRCALLLPLVLAVSLSCKLFDRSDNLQATITAIQAVQTSLAGTSTALAPIAPSLTAIQPSPIPPTQETGSVQTAVPPDTTTPPAETPSLRIVGPTNA